jgi:hypothetical protein
VTCWFTRQPGWPDAGTLINIDGGAGFGVQCLLGDGGPTTITCYGGNVGTSNAHATTALIPDAGLVFNPVGSTVVAGGTFSIPFIWCPLQQFVNLEAGGVQGFETSTPLRVAAWSPANTGTGSGSYQLGVYGLWNTQINTSGVLTQNATVSGIGYDAAAAAYFDVCYDNADPGAIHPNSTPYSSTNVHLQVFMDGVQAVRAQDYLANMPSDGGFPAANQFIPFGHWDGANAANIQATYFLSTGPSAWAIYFGAELGSGSNFNFYWGAFTVQHPTGWIPQP